MPRPLRFIYVASCVASGVGWVVAVAVGRGGPLSQFPILIVPLITMPVAFLLALGFSEDQRWTRPLIVLFLAVSAVLLAIGGHVVIAGLSLVGALGVGMYLYTSTATREYYEFLRETALVRVSLRELRSLEFVPLYLATFCAAAGGVLVYLLIRGLDNTFSDLGAKEAVAAICAGILAAAVAGALGLWVGDKWLSRRTRSA